MAALLRIFAVSSLCILICSLSFAPSTALAHTIAGRDTLRAHGSIAKRKRALQRRRCKAKGLTKPTATETATSSTSTTNKKTTTTSKKPTATPSAPKPVQDANKKVGIAWANPDDTQIKFWAQPKVGHLYTWSPYCPPEAKQNGISCCPQLWGYKSVDQFQSLVKPGYADCALGPNEPNFPGQANIAPGDAVTLWRDNMDPLHNDGYFLVSPACTNGQDGKDWMVQFMQQCTGCHIDAVSLHYYGTDPNDFISWVTDFHTTWGKPIWVTEVACQNFGSGPQCSASQTKDFLDKITGWMDSQSWVQQYFWFGVLHDMSGVNTDNQLIQDNGQPNSLGWDYLT